jgi:hypothetical protein
MSVFSAKGGKLPLGLLPFHGSQSDRASRISAEL